MKQPCLNDNRLCEPGIYLLPDNWTYVETDCIQECEKIGDPDNLLILLQIVSHFTLVPTFFLQ